MVTVMTKVTIMASTQLQSYDDGKRDLIYMSRQGSGHSYRLLESHRRVCLVLTVFVIVFVVRFFFSKLKEGKTKI